MMKKLIKYLLCLLMICMCTSVCAQGQGDVAKIISGDQDYLMLATVVDITDLSVTLAPHQMIYVNGEQTSLRNENIVVDKFRYSYCKDHLDIVMNPRVGDNVFISLDNAGGRYVMANGAYKVNSVDYKMLTFYASESMKNEECLADIVTLAYFVRTNGAMRRFNFENGVLTADADGNKLTLYPTENITETVTFLNIDGKVVDAAKTQDVIMHGEDRQSNKKSDYRWVISYVIIILGVVVGAYAVYHTNSDTHMSKKAKE